jgi:hypothetical protein
MAPKVNEDQWYLNPLDSTAVESGRKIHELYEQEIKEIKIPLHESSRVPVVLLENKGNNSNSSGLAIQMEVYQNMHKGSSQVLASAGCQTKMKALTQEEKLVKSLCEDVYSKDTVFRKPFSRLTLLVAMGYSAEYAIKISAMMRDYPIDLIVESVEDVLENCFQPADLANKNMFQVLQRASRTSKIGFVAVAARAYNDSDLDPEKALEKMHDLTYKIKNCGGLVKQLREAIRSTEQAAREKKVRWALKEMASKGVAPWVIEHYQSVARY